MNNVQPIILAAGKGTRLVDGKNPSPVPKVLHLLSGKPMVAYTLNNLQSAGFSKPVMVVGYKADLVEKTLGSAAAFYVLQEQQLGTAHAAKLAVDHIRVDPRNKSALIRDVLILNGDDSAFYSPETLTKFVSCHKEKGAVASVLTVRGSFQGLGRVVRDAKGNILEIVEKEYLTPKLEKIKEFNTGTYCFDVNWAKKNLPKIKKSKKGEYFLPDAISLAISQGKIVAGLSVPANEWIGINTLQELKKANLKMAKKLA